jgi:Cadherin-like domain/Bacterial cadherin-like domain/RTX calcium-binding nonapeptide repeat (4 copies)/Bacterial Ig domain
MGIRVNTGTVGKKAATELLLGKRSEASAFNALAAPPSDDANSAGMALTSDELQKFLECVGANQAILPVAAAPTPIAGEFPVNTFTNGSQDYSGVTALDGGGFLVTWASEVQDGSGYGIYGQRYTTAGVAVGGEFRINTFITGDQAFASASALIGGGFVVTWSSSNQDGSGYGIYGQRFTAGGATDGGEFRINSETAANQIYSSVTTLSGGGFVVTWTANNQDGSNDGIYAQRYTSAGVADGSEFRVNTFTIGGQALATVAALDNGGFVVAWHSSGQDGSGEGVYAQRYTSAGIADGSEFRVNTFTTGPQDFASVAGLEGGGFVVTWSSGNQDGDDFGIYGQRYTATGIADGGEFVVNSFNVGTQIFSSVTSLNGGGFLVTWTSLNQDGEGGGIYGQRYDAAGVADGVEFRVNETTAGTQFQEFHPAQGVTQLADGSLVATWYGNGTGDTDGVFARRFSLASSSEAPVVDLNGAGSGINIGGSYTEDGAVVTPIEGVVISDADSANLTGATATISNGFVAGDELRLSGGTVGTLFGINFAYNDSTGVLTLAGSATVATYQAVLATLSFNSSSDNPGTTRDIDVVVNDGAAESILARIILDVTATNDAPTIAGLDNESGVYTEDLNTSMRVDVGTNAIIADVDSANFNGGSLTVGVTAGGEPTRDRFGIFGDGVAAVSGNQVSINGVVIGTVTGLSVVGQPIVITFTTDDATAARVQLLVQRIFYAVNQQQDPISGTRIITTTLTDGDGGSTSAVSNMVVIGVNDAPTGTDGIRTINEDQPVALAVANFGFDDHALSSQSESQALRAVIVTTLPTGGTLTLNGANVAAGASISVADINAGLLVYTPASNVNGTSAAAFTFQVQDNGGTANGGIDIDGSANTLTFNVTAVDDAPVAVADSATTPENATVIINVIGNDTDSDGGLRVVTQIDGVAASVGVAITLVSGATATNNGNGTITYNPNGVFNGLAAAGSGGSNLSAPDSFSYTLNGGSSATVSLTVTGVDSDDAVNGTAGNDTLDGGAGSDILDGLGGNDTLRVSGGTTGANTPTETVNGGTGDDHLIADYSTLTEQIGLYVQFQDAGGSSGFADIPNGTRRLTFNNIEQLTITTGSGDDVINGTAGDDFITTGAGTDALISGAGNDVLSGGADDDILVGGANGDTLTGGTGNDRFVYENLTDSDSMERDGIQDFELGDIIDVRTLDANSNVAGNQDFRFIGASGFSGTAGELRYENISVGGPIFLVQGDVNGDGLSDFEVVLVNTENRAFTAADFLGATTNVAPVAFDDSLVATEDTPVIYTAAQLLGNDTDANSDPLTIASVTAISGGTVVLNGDGTVTFTPNSNFNGNAVFDYTVSDGQGGSDIGRATVAVAAVPDAPLVANLQGDTVSFTESGALFSAPLDVGLDALVTDADSTNFNGGTLNIAVTGGVAAEDFIYFNNNNPAFGLTFSGNTISQGGVAFATFDAPSSSRTFTFLNNGSATAERVTQLIRSLSYFNNNSYNPSEGVHTVTYMLTDGSGGTSVTTSTVNVVATNDAPVLDLNAGTAGLNDTNLYVENDTGVGIGNNITITDDSGSLTRATVTITDAVAGDALFANLPLPAGITVDPASTATTLILVGNAPTSAFVSALGQVGYVSSSDDPTAGGNSTSRSVQVVVNDGTADSAPATMTISVSAVNDAPVVNFAFNAPVIDQSAVDVSGGHNISSFVQSNNFTVNGATTLNRFTVFLAESAVATAGAFEGFGGTLSFAIYRDNGNGLPGTLLFTGSDSAPVATDTGTDLGGRDLFQFVVNVGGITLSGGNYWIALHEGAWLSPTDGTDIFWSRSANDTNNNLRANTSNVTAPNGLFATFAPGLAFSLNGATAAVEQTALDLKGKITVADPDAGSSIVTATLSVDFGVLKVNVGTSGVTIVSGSGTGTVLLSGTIAQINDLLNTNATSAVRYTANTDTPPASTNLTVSVNDGGNFGSGGAQIGSATQTIAIIAVNDLPVVDLNGTAAGVDTTASYTEGGVAIRPILGMTISDVDNGTLTGATVTIGTGFVAGDLLRLAGGQSGVTGSGITYSYNAATGVLTLSGVASVADYQTTLAALNFKSSSDNPGTSRDIIVVVNDGAANSVAAHIFMAVTPTDDAPINVVPATQQAFSDTALVFSVANGNALSVADADGSTVVQRVKLTVTNGIATLADLNGLLSVAGDGTRQITITGTAAEINEALNGLTYQNSPGFTGAVTLRLTTFDLGESGTVVGLSDTDAVTINVQLPIASQEARDDRDGAADNANVPPVMGGIAFLSNPGTETNGMDFVPKSVFEIPRAGGNNDDVMNTLLAPVDLGRFALLDSPFIV